MSAAVTYTTFGNTIVHENRNGVYHDYMRDPLGSTVGLLDSSQQISDTFAYWPYGEIQSQTGSTGTPFTFCGTLGYFLDAATQFCYVRARHLATQLARWLTADPLWPRQRAYEYANSGPQLYTDESGLIANCLRVGTLCAQKVAEAAAIAALGLLIVLFVVWVVVCAVVGLLGFLAGGPPVSMLALVLCALIAMASDVALALLAALVDFTAVFLFVCGPAIVNCLEGGKPGS